MKWSELSDLERDGLVHVKVMGKPVKCTGRAETIMVKNPSRVIGEHFEYAKWYCESCGRSGDSLAPVEHDLPGGIPSYSTDMNAAMSALLHLEKWFKLVYDPDGRQGCKYLCLITVDVRCDVSGWSDNPIWAMNLATIKTAVEIEP